MALAGFFINKLENYLIDIVLPKIKFFISLNSLSKVLIGYSSQTVVYHCPYRPCNVRDMGLGAHQKEKNLVRVLAI